MKTLIAVLIALPASLAPAATIEDLTTWSLVEDPPHANLSATATAGSFVLSSNGRVPIGRDIGYAPINGPNVVGSTQGYYFSPAEDFTVAIDHRVALISFFGAGGIGLGIGEGIDGANSAGVVLGFASLSLNTVGLAYGAAARVNDVDHPESDLLSPAGINGRLFVSYEAATGDIVVGADPTRGSTTPRNTYRFEGIQREWNDQPLFVSAFLRSDTPRVGGTTNGISAGTVNATLSNFVVLDGSPLTIPEPAAATLAALAACLCRFGRPVGGFSRSR